MRQKLKTAPLEQMRVATALVEQRVERQLTQQRLYEKQQGKIRQEQAFIDKYYPTTPSISVDYAILEKSNNVYTIPADIGWSDLGTWASLHAESPKREYRVHKQYCKKDKDRRQKKI